MTLDLKNSHNRGPRGERISNTNKASLKTKNLSGFPKAAPQRTTKINSKLKLLPQEDLIETINSKNHVALTEIEKIKCDTARRDAERLETIHRDMLPRVTAYCTAASYQMSQLYKFFSKRKDLNDTSPKRFDECIYSPFGYEKSDQTDQASQEHLLDAHNSSIGGVNSDIPGTINIFEGSEMSEVFCFEYGVVVFWGFIEEEEKMFLRELTPFEIEKLAPDDVEVENFNYYVTKLYQPRIWNDFITLKDGKNYLVKLSISFAIAQSVKISLFEELVDDTIEATKDIPQRIAETGKVHMSRKKIMMSVGELFILRININLQASILDNPELMWMEPQLEPFYKAARSYLEINQRTALLNQRVQVIGDLLVMLKDQMAHSHGEYLEWIVVLLIGAEILIGCINIIVDIYASDGSK